ncbi:MAG TPA: hypothetical protein VL095_06710 [Flavisolibacter sp.]|nr:hypothetical protein [Flavisolibacter sp.]
MKTKLFAAIAAAFLITSCDKKDESPAPSSSTDPQNGSTWVYKLTQYNEAGTATGSVNLTAKGVSVTVNGSTWLNLVDQATMQPIIGIQKKSDGWWYIPYPSSSSSLWFKYPATVNETYSYVFGTCVVKSINASVTVPAGTYNNCYMVEGDDTNSMEDEFWFTTSGPVLVKFNTYDEKAAGPASNVYKKQSMELVSFQR